MKARVPVLIKDPSVAQWKEVPLAEPFTVEDVFLDGPVSPRVAVLDFDPATGALVPGVRFAPSRKPDGPGSYSIANPVTRGATVVDSSALRSAVFGAVHKTIAMFEEPDALGRTVRWAFGAPQLLVVPRAGERANAYYERESHSLQFFYFDAGQTVARGSTPPTPRTSSPTRRRTRSSTASRPTSTARSRRSRSPSTRRVADLAALLCRSVAGS